MTPDLSVVIPIRNESPNVRKLYEEFVSVLGAWGRPFELVIVDDGSTDDSFAILVAAAGARPAPARDPVPPQLRPDGRVLGGLPLRARHG